MHLLHPALLMIFFDLNNFFATKYGLDIVVTATISTPDEDKKLGRTSTSHQDMIAIDFRTRNISKKILIEGKDYIESKPEYEKYKYLSYSGEKRLIFIHDNGNGEHAHLQIHKKFSM